MIAPANHAGIVQHFEISCGLPLRSLGLCGDFSKLYSPQRRRGRRDYAEKN